MIRRLLFGLMWFVILWLGTTVVGGGIAGAAAGAKAAPADAAFGQGFDAGYQAGAIAGARFRKRFGGMILGGAAAIAVAGTAGGVLPGTRRTLTDQNKHG